MVEGIGDNGILLGEERAKESAVGIEAGGVQDGVFGVEIFGDGGLELFVDVLGSTNEADGRHAEATAVHCLLG